MKKIIIWLFLIGIVAAGGVYLYLFHFGARHKDPLKAGNLIEIQADSLYRSFEYDEEEANKLFLGKTLKVSGEIESIQLNRNRYSVYFNSGGGMGSVMCEMDTTENDRISTLKAGDQTSIAGFCNGINLDVYLDRCKLAADLP